jgi:hypothetical protein
MEAVFDLTGRTDQHGPPSPAALAGELARRDDDEPRIRVDEHGDLGRPGDALRWFRGHGLHARHRQDALANIEIEIDATAELRRQAQRRIGCGLEERLDHLLDRGVVELAHHHVRRARDIRRGLELARERDRRATLHRARIFEPRLGMLAELGEQAERADLDLVGRVVVDDRAELGDHAFARVVVIRERCEALARRFTPAGIEALELATEERNRRPTEPARDSLDVEGRALGTRREPIGELPKVPERAVEQHHQGPTLWKRISGVN